MWLFWSYALNWIQTIIPLYRSRNIKWKAGVSSDRQQGSQNIHTIQFYILNLTWWLHCCFHQRPAPVSHPSPPPLSWPMASPHHPPHPLPPRGISFGVGQGDSGWSLWWRAGWRSAWTWWQSGGWCRCPCSCAPRERRWWSCRRGRCPRGSPVAVVWACCPCRECGAGKRNNNTWWLTCYMYVWFWYNTVSQ